MAYFRIQLYVNALRRQASFEMLIPNDMHVEAPVGEAIQPAKQLKTLFLLHGYTGCAGNWVPEELAARYGFAIVMPSVENSFYLDGISTGHQFQTFVGEELVDYVRRTFGLARSPADTRTSWACRWAVSARCTRRSLIRRRSARRPRFPLRSLSTRSSP